jgi:hypothetical protein
MTPAGRLSRGVSCAHRLGEPYEIIVRAVAPDVKSAKAVLALARRWPGRPARGSERRRRAVESSAEALADFLLASVFSNNNKQ